MVNRTKLGIIAEPTKPNNIPLTSQWLAGQGAGSWFNVQNTTSKNKFKISRFNPNGLFEFEAIFEKNNTSVFCLDCPYVFTYLSHYLKCNIIQHGEVIEFVNNNDR